MDKIRPVDFDPPLEYFGKTKRLSHAKYEEGYFDAIRQLSKEAYMTIIRADPEQFSPALANAIELANEIRDEHSSPKRSHAITLNLGNFTEFGHLVTHLKFLMEYLKMSTWCQEYYLVVEQAPITKRLHVHGCIKAQTYYPCDVQRAIFSKMRTYFNKLSETTGDETLAGFNTKHVVVKRTYGGGWLDYVNKEKYKGFPSYCYSQNDTLEDAMREKDIEKYENKILGKSKSKKNGIQKKQLPTPVQKGKVRNITPIKRNQLDGSSEESISDG